MHTLGLETWWRGVPREGPPPWQGTMCPPILINLSLQTTLTKLASIITAVTHLHVVSLLNFYSAIIFYPTTTAASGEECLHLFQRLPFSLRQKKIEEPPSHHRYTSEHEKGPSDSNSFRKWKESHWNYSVHQSVHCNSNCHSLCSKFQREYLGTIDPCDRSDTDWKES